MQKLYNKLLIQGFSYDLHSLFCKDIEYKIISIVKQQNTLTYKFSMYFIVKQ